MRAQESNEKGTRCGTPIPEMHLMPVQIPGHSHIAGELSCLL